MKTRSCSASFLFAVFLVVLCSLHPVVCPYPYPIGPGPYPYRSYRSYRPIPVPTVLVPIGPYPYVLSGVVDKWTVWYGPQPQLVLPSFASALPWLPLQSPERAPLHIDARTRPAQMVLLLRICLRGPLKALCSRSYVSQRRGCSRLRLRSTTTGSA